MGTSKSGALAATDAFAALVQQTARALYGYLRGLMADEEQARDLMQDVFCDAWRAAKQDIPPFDLEGDERGLQPPEAQVPLARPFLCGATGLYCGPGGAQLDGIK